jgi:hypothetical protein
MSDPDPIRIAAQPESPEQAAQMIAHHQAGAYELVGGAVLGLPAVQGFTLWPFMWLAPTGGGPAALTTAVAAYQQPDGTPRGGVAIATAWRALHFAPPYTAALLRLTVTFVGLPDPPAPLAFWIAARRHARLLPHLVTQQRLMLFATKPPPTAFADLAVLGTLPGLSIEFDGGLAIVQELLDLLSG